MDCTHALDILTMIVLIGAGPEEDISSDTCWTRPPLKEPLDPAKDKVTFQQIDIDHYVGELCQQDECIVSMKLNPIWIRLLPMLDI